MAKEKPRKVIVNLTEELSASELELLRRNAEAMEQSLESHIAWVLFGASRKNKAVSKGLNTERAKE